MTMLTARRKNNFCRALRQIFLICLLPFTVAAHGNELQDDGAKPYPSDDAQAWLDKMSEAHSTLNYSISFVLLKPGVDSQPYLWRHGVDSNGHKMEQLNLLNGPGREMVRMGNKVSYFEPNVPPYSLQSSVINGPFPSDFFRQPKEVRSSYDFVLVGRSRISGRAAQQIRVVSKDKTRFGMNLWLDQETGLMLKLNLVDLNGQLLEQIQVTACQVTEQPDPFFAKIELAILPDVLKMRPPHNNKPIWNIDYFPVGMKEIKRDVHRLPITGKTVEYVMLSDGLVDVSVYMRESQNDGLSQDILLRHESDTLLTRNQGQLNVTVIGKLPPKTANDIANSIRRVPVYD
ncbi:MAG: sigma-E factor negative regulatory protein RseB [Paraglaciecola sp.]|jgi:sigma-E factor negative regulatory protein RseB